MLPLQVVPRHAHSLPPAEAWAELPLHEVVSGRPPEQATTVRGAWDGAALALHFRCVDADPWATLTVRDAPLYTEEVVEVFVDPFGDGLVWFEVEVNPLGTVLDLTVRRTRFALKKDFRWRWEGLEASAQKVPGGWEARLHLPLAALTGAPPEPGARWRVNFCRIDRPRGRERELSAWSPTGQPNFHVPERFGTLEFA